MSKYMIVNGELYHYGVAGMKWGIRKANYKSARSDKLKKKALDYDKKAANLTKKAEKAHAKYDLETANKRAVKAAKLDKKAAVTEKKAAKASTDLGQAVLYRKAEKLKYKAATNRIKGDRLSKSAGYGAKAMKYSIKSDKLAKKAAKTRLKLATDKRYVEKMKTKISKIPEADIKAGYSFVNEMRQF